MQRLQVESMLTATALTLLLAGPALAQEPVCDRSRTFNDCYVRLTGGAASQAVLESATEELAAKASSSIAPNAGRALLDLLPTFASSIGIDGLKNSDGQLTFDRRFEAGQWRISLKGTAYLDAQLYEPLRAKLPDAIRETRSNDLDKEIGDFDKVDYQLTITREKDTGDIRFGRDPDDYDDLASALASNEVVNIAAEQNQWAAKSSALLVLPPESPQSPTFVLLNEPISTLISSGKLTEAKVQTIESSLEDVVDGMKKSLTTIDDSTDRLDELINNQPQLLFDAVYKDRDPLTGPVEQSASFTYEMGVAGNVNKYLRWARTNVSDACRGNAFQRTCFESFLKTYPNAGDAGQRLAFSLSYADIRPIHFELPADQFVFDQPGSEKLVGSLTYGRYFPNFQFFNQILPAGVQDDSQPNQGTRIDLEAKYEDPVEDDGMLKSRLVATLTFTQGMTLNTGMSFSLVYANKPEFLGDVDDKLSANLGIRWKTGMPGGN